MLTKPVLLEWISRFFVWAVLVVGCALAPYFIRHIMYDGHTAELPLTFPQNEYDLCCSILALSIAGFLEVKNIITPKGMDQNVLLATSLIFLFASVVLMSLSMSIEVDQLKTINPTPIQKLNWDKSHESYYSYATILTWAVIAFNFLLLLFKRHETSKTN
jgi:hypothetical protein